MATTDAVRGNRVGQLRRQMHDLVQADIDDGGFGYRAVVPAGYRLRSPRDALISLGRDGHAHLLLPVTSLKAVIEDHHSAGVVLIGREVIDHDGVQKPWADLECRADHLRDTWLLLVDEVLATMESSDDAADAIALRTLARWRELIARPSGTPLSRGDLVGLFGELLVISAAPDSASMLSAWRGPDRSRHDFSSGRDALEVKTTASADGETVVIHGLSQLEEPPQGGLYLLRIRIEQSDQGRCVPDLVEQVLQRGVVRPDLYAKLAAVGYLPEHEEDYGGLRFSVRATDCWRVGDGFPRIRTASFVGGSPPAGTVIRNYEIDLTHARPWKVTGGQLPLALRFVGELHES